MGFPVVVARDGRCTRRRIVGAGDSTERRGLAPVTPPRHRKDDPPARPRPPSFQHGAAVWPPTSAPFFAPPPQRRRPAPTHGRAALESRAALAALVLPGPAGHWPR